MVNRKKLNTTSNFSTDKTQEDKKTVIESATAHRSVYLRERRKKNIDRRSIFISRIKRRALRHLWLVRTGFLFGIILSFFALVALFGVVFRNTNFGFYVALAGDFIFAPADKVKSRDGRTNIVVLGKRGSGYEAPDLTDTIIFTSIKHNPNSVTLISLSRDIWIPEIRAKLNSTYYWGNQKKPPTQGPSGPEGGGGLILAKSTIEKIVGTPVHYGLVVDFSGFKEIIDEVGGIDVYVARTFEDDRYPILGKEEDECGGDPEFKCRYETVSFKTGNKLMDGETALKFVRSRNAKGEEGTDMARAKRQQLVLAATREKAVSLSILLNPKKLYSIFSLLGESIETDIDPPTAAILLRWVFSAKENIYSEVLSEDLLENPPKSIRYDNLYVFIPKDDTWGEIQEWVECVLKNGDCN